NPYSFRGPWPSERFYLRHRPARPLRWACVRSRLAHRKVLSLSGSIFTGVHNFFHSGTWTAVEAVGAAVILLFWLATIAWVLKDARRRIESPLLIALATLIGAFPPFLGPLIYMLFRPPEYLEDVRERDLEIKAIESRLGGPEVRCKVCGCEVEPDF